MDENEISKIVLDAAIMVHRTLGGPGLLESVYQDALVYELRTRGLKVAKEVIVPVKYKGVVVGDPLRIDIFVEDRIVVECKATEKDNPIYAVQTLTYLRILGLHLGLLINFGKETLIAGYRRVVN
jgi:GxxExxY protein